MKIIETKVYQFDELSDAAKEKARDWYRESTAGDNFFSECVLDDAEECAKLIGLTIGRARGGKAPAFYWSGFSSQGDGACFEGHWTARAVQPGKLKEHAPVDAELHRISAEFERIALAFPEASFTVKHSGRYSHKFCTDFDVWLEESGAELDAGDKAETDLIEAARDLMDWIYSQLEKEYEYQNSNEQVDESIRANEYSFTENGNRF